MCQVLYCWNHVFAQSQTYHKAKKVFWQISQSRWYNKQINKLALYHWHILYRSKVKSEPIGYLSYSRAKPTNIRARSTSQVVTRKRDVGTAVSFSKILRLEKKCDNTCYNFDFEEMRLMWKSTEYPYYCFAEK